MRITAASEYTGQPVYALKAAVANGQLTALQPSGPGGHLFFRERDLDEWLRKMIVRP
jgi:hypothetical protein